MEFKEWMHAEQKQEKLLLVELEDLNPFLSLQVQVLKLKRDF